MITKEAVYEFEEFRLNAKKQRLYRKGAAVALPPKAIELLILMAENQGKVLEKDDIIEALWQDTFVEESNLTQTVYLLRKALGKKKTANRSSPRSRNAAINLFQRSAKSCRKSEIRLLKRQSNHRR